MPLLIKWTLATAVQEAQVDSAAIRTVRAEPAVTEAPLAPEAKVES